jgi:hypothetical protein
MECLDRPRPRLAQNSVLAAQFLDDRLELPALLIQRIADAHSQAVSNFAVWSAFSARSARVAVAAALLALTAAW